MTAPIGKPPDVPPLEQVEKEMLVRALDNTGWNIALAARLLGVSRDTMRYRMEKNRLVHNGECGMDIAGENAGDGA